MDIVKTKKRIAREVLLMFGIVAVSAASWGILLLRNEYYKDQQKGLIDEVLRISSELDSLNKRIIYKKDYINRVYKAIYEITDSLNLSEAQFRNAMYDSIYSKKIYKILKNNLEGFYPTEPEFLNNIKDGNDTSEIYTYVINNDTFDLPFQEISSFLNDYPNAKNIHTQVIIDTTNPKYLITQIKDFEIEKAQKRESQISATSSIWNDNKIKTTFQYILLVLVILVYPVRICFFLLKWALKTVRT